MFSDADLSLLKKTFSENDDLLYAIRNVMLQFPLTEAEKDMMRTQVTPEVYRLIKMKLYPEVDPSAPLTQLADLHQTLTNDLKVKTPEEMEPIFEAKMTEMAYLKQQVAAIADLDAAQPLKLDDMRLREGMSAREAFVATSVRNFILGFVDPMLRDLKVLGGASDEPLYKQKERLTRNSAK